MGGYQPMQGQEPINPYQSEPQRKTHLPHLQKRIYPGMVDQSFDSVQASSQDKYLLQDSTSQPYNGYPNTYGSSMNTQSQHSMDQQLMKQTSQTELFGGTPGQASQKSDLDKMPRPLQLINQYNFRAGIAERFATKSVEIPPSAGIPFIQIDEGQVGPKFMRSTVIQAPLEQSFQTQSNIPFGFLVQPLAEMTQYEYQDEIPDVPLIDYDNEGPFRCHRCKAYVNPNMVFLEGGTKAQCNLCQYINEVPVNYQSALNEFGQRRDRLQRPELLYGAYEFMAPPTYITRKISGPTFVFVIDVSQFSLPQAFFQQVIQSIKMTLDYMQNPENTQICFITYDINLHFYSLPQDPNAEPTILWVGEIQDPFIPYPKEKLMLRLVDDREKIDIFLDKLLNLHNFEVKKYQAPFLCTGAAVSAAKQLIAEEGKIDSVRSIGGRILVFSSNICSSGVGSLLWREDTKLYNTDKEKVLLSPVNDFYVKLAEECIEQRICVDLIYAINSAKSIDLTSIAPVATLTGGDLHLFSPFDPMKHGEKLHYEIFRILTRTQGTEVAIKARASTGLTVTEYFGSFGFKEIADFSLAAIDCDKSLGFVVRNDEKLKEDPNTQAFVQFAMMYNTQYGQKRIRVFNYNLLIAKNLNAYYKVTDQETLSAFMIKHELSRVFLRGAKSTRELLTNNLVNMLHAYRSKCAAKTSPQNMVLPEQLKLLPLYTLTAFKNPALKMFPGVKIDDKIYWIYKLLRMSLSQLPFFFYPRVYKVTDINHDTFTQSTEDGASTSIIKPQATQANLQYLSSTEAYVIDNGEYIFLYLGQQVNDAFIQNVNRALTLQVFGYANFSDLKFNGITSFTPLEESPISQLLWQFIEHIRYEKVGVTYQPLRLIYAGDMQEKEMIESCLVEDSVDINKEFPYNEFMQMLHKLIRNKVQ